MGMALNLFQKKAFKKAIKLTHIYWIEKVFYGYVPFNNHAKQGRQVVLEMSSVYMQIFPYNSL